MNVQELYICIEWGKRTELGIVDMDSSQGSVFWNLYSLGRQIAHLLYPFFPHL